MIRRILGTLLVLLGLVAAALGVASATIWRPSDTVTATMPAPESPVVLVEPGVLGLVADTVTLRATAPEEDLPIVLAFAPSSDVEAWVDGAAVTRVTGLEDWNELAVSTSEGDSTVPDPSEADIWRNTLPGTGELVVEITPDPGQVTLLAATDGTAAAPELSLSWPREVSTPYLVPALIVGGVLLLLGIGVLAYDMARRHTAKAQQESRVKADRMASSDITDTAAIPVTEDMPEGRLTRRQLRELERKRRAADPRLGEGGPVATTGGTVGAGIVPGVTSPERFRALRYVEDSPEITPDSPASSRFAPPAAEAAEHEDVAEAPDRSESLAASGAGAGAGIVPDSLAAASARAAEDRDAAGAAHGAGIVPPREAGTEQPGYEAATDLPEHEAATDLPEHEAGTDEPEHEAATDLPETEEITAHGAGIVPPRAASADEVQDDETPAPSIQDAIGARGTDREEAPVTWRDLWGFRRDSGSTEEK